MSYTSPSILPFPILSTTLVKIGQLIARFGYIQAPFTQKWLIFTAITPAQLK
jgi:hypothetical protein